MRKTINLFILFLVFSSKAQTSIKNPFEDLAFTKNEGQWVNEEKETARKIYFGAALQGKLVFITNKGLVYKYLDYYHEKKGLFEKWFSLKKEKKEDTEEESEEFYKEGKYVARYVFINYEDCNIKSEIVSENKTSSYTIYSDPRDPSRSIKAYAYKRIILKNIYPYTDVDFIIKPTGGFEYNFVIRPNANIDHIKINYKGIDQLSLDEQNQLVCVIDKYKNINETKPVAYDKESKQVLSCNRTLKGNTQQFSIEEYNKSRTVVIDPVVFNPALTSYNRVYDLAKDNNGNILVFGGLCPYVLKKFSSTGVLLWSFDWSTQPTPSTLYGDFVVDQTGNVTMLQGYPNGRIIKTDPNGIILFNTIPAWVTTFAEFWRLAYNCNYSAIRVSGYIGTPTGIKQIIDINPLNGNLLATSPAAADESRSLFIDPTGEIYSLTPTQGLSSNPATNYFTKFDVALNQVYKVVSGYNVNEGQGIYQNVTYNPTDFYANMNGITADVNNAFTYDGATIFKRAKSNGAASGSIAVPNGITLANSGIIIDPCSNVFAGTQNGVVRLDTNLNIINTLATPGQVYDLCLLNNGNILAAGNGFVVELNFNTSCNLTVVTTTITNTACKAPFNGSASVSTPTNGVAPFTYLWNNGATTQTITNLAPGKYWVLTKDSYCGNAKTSVDTVVIPNAPVFPNLSVNSATICNGSSGILASSGTGASTYTWAPSASLSGINNSSVTANPTVTTTYSVSGESSLGCISNYTTFVNVNPLPVLSTSDFTICNGNSATVSISGALNYTWTPATGLNNTSSATVVASPSVTTNYSITGSDVNGCATSTISTVNVNNAPALATTSNSFCAGQSATISVNGAANYTWTPSSSLSSSGGTVVTANPSVTTIYSVTGTDVNGCISSATSTVVVNPLPSLTISSSNVCNGNSATLAAVGAGVSNYTWMPGNYLSSPNSATTAASLSVTTNFTLLAQTAQGCANSFTANVTVLDLPSPNFVSDSVCLGLPTTLTDASSANGTPFYMFSWDFNSDNIPDLTNNLLSATNTFSNGGNNPVSYTVYTSPNGGNLICSKSVTNNVWVHPLPNASITNINTCIDTQPSLISGASSSIAIGSISNYAWNYGNGSTSLANSSALTSFSYSTAGNYPVTLTVTSNAGCTNAATQTISVWEKPYGNFSYSKTCLGKSTSFTGSQAGISGNIINYGWDFNNTPLSIEANGLQVTTLFSAAGTQTVNMIMTTDKGCKNIKSGSIYINYNPKAAFNVPQRAGCPDFCAKIMDSTMAITGPGKIINWDWNFGNGATYQSANGSLNTVCYGNPSNTSVKNYSIKLVLKTDSGCVDSISKSNYITVYPNPVANFAWQGIDGDVLTPKISFTNTSIGYTKFAWYFNDGINITDSSKSNPIHYFNTDVGATYNVFLAVRNSYGCKDTISIPVVINPVFTFYIPNAFTPNADGLNDIFIGKGIGIKTYHMWIFDRWGEKIFYTDDINKGWDGTVKGKVVEDKTDVYQWKVIVSDYSNKKHEYVGHVTLIK